MDPNLFHIDWERTSEVLVALIIFSFLMERALSMIFESRWFIDWRDAVVAPAPNDNSIGDADCPPKRRVDYNLAAKRKRSPIKEIIAVLVAVAGCAYWQFDAVSMIFLKSTVTWLGFVITGAIIAGGSKASIKLFRDIMGIHSGAEGDRQDAKKEPCDKDDGGPNR